MSLLERVIEHLEGLRVPHALIGAAAMAFHGASRATIDIDLLVMDPRVLESATWEPFGSQGVEVDLRRGDADDPLAGVVRLSSAEERAVDLVVGRAGWQREVIERASPASYASVELPVVRAADLVLLKLYAGGPQDAWDIRQLVAGEGHGELIDAVEAVLSDLGEDAKALWRRILDEA